MFAPKSHSLPLVRGSTELGGDRRLLLLGAASAHCKRLEESELLDERWIAPEHRRCVGATLGELMYRVEDDSIVPFPSARELQRLPTRGVEQSLVWGF